MTTELLTIPEVARLLRVRPIRAYQLVRDGVIPGVRLGRQVRVEKNTLLAWIGHGGKPLPGGWRRKLGSAG